MLCPHRETNKTTTEPTFMQEQRFLYSNPGKDHAQHSSTESEGKRPEPLLQRVYIEKNQKQGAICLGVL